MMRAPTALWGTTTALPARSVLPTILARSAFHISRIPVKFFVHAAQFIDGRVVDRGQITQRVLQ